MNSETLAERARCTHICSYAQCGTRQAETIRARCTHIRIYAQCGTRQADTVKELPPQPEKGKNIMALGVPQSGEPMKPIGINLYTVKKNARPRLPMYSG